MAALAGVVGRALLQAALGDSLPFVLAAPIAVFCGLMWGAGPGALAAFIGLLGALAPGSPPDIDSPDGRQSTVLFIAAMVGVCLAIARMDSLTRKAQPAEATVESPLVRWLNATLLLSVLVPSTAFVVVAWWTYAQDERTAREAASHRGDLIYNHAQRTFDLAERLTSQAATLTAGEATVIRPNEQEPSCSFAPTAPFVRAGRSLATEQSNCQ